MLNLLLAGVMAVATTGGGARVHRVPMPTAARVSSLEPPVECPPDQVPFVVGTVYADDYGAPATHLEFVCSDPDGSQAEARVDVIEATGFEPEEGQRIAHGAVRRVYYHPVH